MRGGYGILYHKGKTLYAHRVSWELNRGPIPEGLWVLHNCPGGDNPACVDPAHLWLGTASDNSKDRDAKGRGNFKRTVLDLNAIRARLAQGASRKALAKELGVHRDTIAKALKPPM